MGEGYAAKLQSMWDELAQWRKTNPHTQVLIQFKVPTKIFVTSTLGDAIRHGFLIFDDNGKRMLEELGWLGETMEQPTLMMAKVVLEHGSESSE